MICPLTTLVMFFFFNDTATTEIYTLSLHDALPISIYVRAILELLRSGLPVHGLAHITGGGVQNLTRLAAPVGFAIESPLPAPPVFELVQRLGDVPPAQMWDVFNMGCGFCVVVRSEEH